MTKVPASKERVNIQELIVFQSGYLVMDNDLLSAHIDNCGRVVKLSVKGEEK